MALKDLINPRPVSEPDDKGSGPIEDVEEVAQVATGRVDRASDSQIPRGVSEVVTPSGISIYYQAAPKRLYRIGRPGYKVGSKTIHYDVPSVSEVLDILAKGGLPWWGMEIGIRGIIGLWHLDQLDWILRDPQPDDVKELVSLLVEHKLTVNHVRDQAGDRGTSVHTALELWADTGLPPTPEVYAEEEQGYVQGLCKFLDDSGATAVASEVMVASVKHKYAGRYDLDANLGGVDGADVFTHITPKGKGDKKENIEAGLWRIDLKTSGAVYDSYHLQIEAYEEAARECGYPGTENRGILRVTEDGRYELKRSKATFADFKAVLSAFKALQRVKAR